jgi:hypothetical protein
VLAAEEAPQDSLAEEGEKGVITSTLAKANPLAATGQTVDAVRWMAKRRQFMFKGKPYGFTGLPVIYFHPNAGWNYGARVQWADYQRRPYRYKVTLNFLRSSEGRLNSFVRIKVPRISGTGFGVVILASSKRDLRTRFYGLGNNSRFVEGYVDPNSDVYKDENYYYYALENPRFVFRLLREIRGPLSLSTALGLERTDADARSQISFLKDEGTPDGVTDGVTGFISATLQWDTRDDETVARRGVFHEWSYETSRSSVLAFLFDQIDFQRYTFTDARYLALSQRLNVANRAVFEVLTGSVPLYAYGQIGGSRRIKGLGGSDSLRGYDRQRFTDDVRLFTNTEVRYQLYSMFFFKQYLEWHGALFADSGRVWPDVSDLTISDIHWTGGIGLRLYWNSDFVIRSDFGVSKEQMFLGLKYRNSF